MPIEAQVARRAASASVIGPLRLGAKPPERRIGPLPRIRAVEDRRDPIATCVATLFPSARSETRQTLVQSAPLRAYGRHDHLLRQGEHAAVVAIVSGNVAVRTGDDDGRRLTMGILGSGDVVGLLSVSRFTTSLDDVVGLTSGTWASWTGLQMRRLSQVDPGLAADLFDHAMESMARFQELLAQATFESARERFARVLVDYEHLICRTDTVLSRAEVASLVGVTREMIGIVMRDFEAMGLISRIDAVIEILDRPGLDALFPQAYPSVPTARFGIPRRTERRASGVADRRAPVSLGAAWTG
jgi:CRP/FNR family transcriptional regulator, cyclic AMP receptor protein